MSVAASLKSTIIEPLSKEHKSTVIWMHGLGDTSEGFAELFRERVQAAMPNTRFVLPNAAKRAVTVNGGQKMQAWYDILTFDRANFVEDAKGMDESRAKIEQLIAEEAKLTDKIIIGGFSQGGTLAMLTGVQSAIPLAGIVSSSGYLCQKEKFPDSISEANRKTPLLAFYGERDHLLPWWFVGKGYDHLKSCNIDLTLVKYPNMGHEVSNELLARLVKFANERFATTTTTSAASVKNTKSADQLAKETVANLKSIPKSNQVEHSDCVEKTDLVQRIIEKCT